MMTTKSGSVPLFLDRGSGKEKFCGLVLLLAEIKIKAQDIEWTGKKNPETIEASSTLSSALHGFQMDIILAHTHTPGQGIL